VLLVLGLLLFRYRKHKIQSRRSQNAALFGRLYDTHPMPVTEAPGELYHPDVKSVHQGAYAGERTPFPCQDANSRLVR